MRWESTIATRRKLIQGDPESRKLWASAKPKGTASLFLRVANKIPRLIYPRNFIVSPHIFPSLLFLPKVSASRSVENKTAEGIAYHRLERTTNLIIMVRVPSSSSSWASKRSRLTVDLLSGQHVERLYKFQLVHAHYFWRPTGRLFLILMNHFDCLNKWN